MCVCVCVCVCVCDIWGTQTTAIDIAEQNSEVTVFPPPGRGGFQRGGGGFKVGGGSETPWHKLVELECVTGLIVGLIVGLGCTRDIDTLGQARVSLQWVQD